MINFIKCESIYIDWHPVGKECVLYDVDDTDVDGSYAQPLYEKLMRIDPCTNDQELP